MVTSRKGSHREHGGYVVHGFGDVREGFAVTEGTHGMMIGWLFEFHVLDMKSEWVPTCDSAHSW